MINNSSNILVIHVSSRVGDSLLVTPLLKTLKRQYENSYITLLAHKRMATLFDYSPDVDRVGIISEKRSRYKGWVLGKKYDLAFVVSGPEENLESITKYALRVSHKVVAFESNSAKLNKKIQTLVGKDFTGDRHIIDYYHDLTNALNIHPANKRVRFCNSSEEITKAKHTVTTSNLNKCQTLIGVKITSLSSRSYRDWPLDNFIDLASIILKEKQNVGFVILGGLDEYDKYDFLAKNIDAPVLNLSGGDLRDFGAIINLLDIYIGVDTGVTHLVSSFNIPMVVLYHPLNPVKKYGPINHPNFYPIECVQCKEQNNEAVAMSTVTSSNVFEKINLALSK
jgi:heptosyltransferase-3